jgi:hypothetical protein
MKLLIIILALVVGLAVSGLAEDYHYTTAARIIRTKETHLLIRPVPVMFQVNTELEALLTVYQYLHERFEYVDDDENHHWTSSDTMFERMSGDCEDWAMLFVAMLRFSTTKPIPADRIWVAVSFDPTFGGHAWVLYHTKYGQTYSFDVVKDIYGHKGWQVSARYIAAMFNDEYSHDLTRTWGY